MNNSVTPKGGMIACADCIRDKFEPHNYILDRELQPERHFCPWCAKEKPEIFWFRIENRTLTDKRIQEERARQKKQLAEIRGKDTRAHYKEKFWEEEVS